jgi:hypothetical protein
VPVEAESPEVDDVEPVPDDEEDDELVVEVPGSVVVVPPVVPRVLGSAVSEDPPDVSTSVSFPCGSRARSVHAARTKQEPTIRPRENKRMPQA